MEFRERAKVLLTAAESVSDAAIAEELRSMAKELLIVAKDVELFEKRITWGESKAAPIHLPALMAVAPKH